MSIDKENTQGESNMGVFKRAWILLKPFHKTIYVILGFQVLILVFQFTGPYIYGLIIDGISSKASINHIVVLVVIAFIVAMLEMVLHLIKEQIEIKRFDWDANRHVDDQIAQKLFSLSIDQHRNEHTGMVQAVINDGRSSIKDIFFVGMYQAMPVALSLPVATVAVLWLSVPVGLIVVAGMTLYFLSILYINSKFRPEIRNNQERWRKVSKRSIELLRNSPTVIMNAEESRTVEDIRARMIDRDAHGKSLWSRFVVWASVTRTGIIEISLSLALIVAAVLASEGSLRTGAIVTLMLWVNRIFGDISMVGRMSRVLLEAKEKATKFFRMFDVQSNVPLPANPVFIKPKGEIEFQDVFFAYSEEKINKDDSEKEEKPEKRHQALNGISFRVSPGEHIAFVGKSGSGKSTTAMIMLRGEDPTSGKVLIDGVDLRNVDLETFRRSVGVVEQNITLFDDTMRHNVSYGLGEGRLLSDEELDEIAKTTRIDQFKDRLTNGWDTIIGENGVKLSGGERQRVGIARALAKNPSILVFDEATSSLDPENERLIKEAIDKVSEGRTVISIAHRLSTILNANRIFVFEKGKIVDVGTHEELLKRSPAYQVQVSGQTVVV